MRNTDFQQFIGDSIETMMEMMQMSIPIDRASQDASKYMFVCKFWSGRSNIFGKYSFFEFVPMEAKDFLITVGLILIFVEEGHILIDRAR